MAIYMVPNDVPVEVPPGGSFSFDGILMNNTPTPYSTDVWIMISVPGYGLFGPVQQYNNIPMGEYQILHTDDAVQDVPAYAPAGDYTYIAYCGDYPNLKTDSSYFGFTVTPTNYIGNASDWNLSGGFASLSNPDVPTEYVSVSNYPNPFNAATTINFTNPSDGVVKLDIYNLLGRKISTLINRTLSAGEHSITWNGADYSSGIYYYKLTVGNNVYTKRMTLLK